MIQPLRTFIAVIIAIIFFGSAAFYFFVHQPVKNRETMNQMAKVAPTQQTDQPAPLAPAEPAQIPTTTLKSEPFPNDPIDPQAKLLAKGDFSGDGKADAIVQEITCGASCSVNLIAITNYQSAVSKRFENDPFAPAYMSSGAAKSELTSVTIKDGLVVLTGKGLDCSDDCTETTWNQIRTLRFRFDGSTFIKLLD